MASLVLQARLANLASRGLMVSRDRLELLVAPARMGLEDTLVLPVNQANKDIRGMQASLVPQASRELGVRLAHMVTSDQQDQQGRREVSVLKEHLETMERKET